MKQRATLNELNKQVEEHQEAERRKAEEEKAKLLRDKEEMDRTLRQRVQQREEAKKQKDAEDRKIIRRTIKQIEQQKRQELQEKSDYRETVSQQEQQKALVREEEEKREDLRFLQESLRMEKEAESRRIAERQRHVEAHQSRADRIAPTEFADAATRSAIERYNKEQAELDKKQLAHQLEKKQAAIDNAAYLKRQTQERQNLKKAEIEERRKVQQEQEKDARNYKLELEAKEKQKRMENMKQQELLLQQIEEHKRRTDLIVSPTEIKLNRALLEKVKAYRENRPARASERRRSDDTSDSDGS
ncbi:rhoptry protein ROP14 [Besnoitia besnoiti]|uniref:Rhoptry protein ROP14 n=1 Tax=Besnoitia besnoiti TaxID=94643 RepID=A0A2A9MJ15_BESBE|nr:rhoptry protein ROP14 [Besnoitia besnoiti]PFH37184.1 rhoptry protein ROP14 [Besnoitia besnoiti]